MVILTPYNSCAYPFSFGLCHPCLSLSILHLLPAIALVSQEVFLLSESPSFFNHFQAATTLIFLQTKRGQHWNSFSSSPWPKNERILCPGHMTSWSASFSSLTFAYFPTCSKYVSCTKILTGPKIYYSCHILRFCIDCFFFLVKQYLPSPPFPTQLERGLHLGSLNLLGQGTYHLYYNYMISYLFSALDCKIL